jgi:DNA replication protein DnaC
VKIADQEQGASTITAQLPVAAWHEMIGEATLADAILDRIVHNAHRITLEGDSMRKRKIPTLLTGGEITEINHP